MREHLVALVYILLISGVVFAVLYRPLTARLMTTADYKRRAGLWIAVTLITFLAHHYWVALLASALVIALASRRETNPVALYCALLFVVPQFIMQIPGFGLINQLFEIDHPRMLAIVLLLPAALRLAGQVRSHNPRMLLPDLLFGTYFVYVFLAHATTDSITGLMRQTVYVLLDHALLYYVMTRSVVDRRRFYDVLASFTLALVVAAPIGVFEHLRHWLLYESLRAPLGVPFVEIGAYLMRITEDGANLRAYTTMGHAIAFGTMCMIALSFQIALAGRYVPRAAAVGVVIALLAASLAALSRGPWVGTAVALLVGLAFGPGAGKRLLWMLGLAPLVLSALLLSEQGQKFIDLLPFVGTVEAGNVTYRQQLIDRAMIVFWQNPVFGSLQFIDNPVLEEMRQGQGIIDIVNSYVGVALAYGAVGLLLFIAPAAYALGAALTARWRIAPRDASAEQAGRAVAMALLGNLIVIATASQIFHIPITHWLLVGLCITYAVWAPVWRAVETAVPSGRTGRPLVRPAARPAWRF